MKLVSFNIEINAWLDCSHPFISLHNKNDGDLMAYFNSDKINDLIETGDITVDELQSTNQASNIETVTTLLSIQQQEAIYKRLQDTRFTIVQRNKKKVDKVTNQKPSESSNPSQDVLFPFIGLSTA